jgi:hypothetical protein
VCVCVSMYVTCASDSMTIWVIDPVAPIPPPGPGPGWPGRQVALLKATTERLSEAWVGLPDDWEENKNECTMNML